MRVLDLFCGAGALYLEAAIAVSASAPQIAPERIVGKLFVRGGEWSDSIPAFNTLPDGEYALVAVDRTNEREGKDG